MPVVGAAFLLAIGRALARIHIGTIVFGGPSHLPLECTPKTGGRPMAPVAPAIRTLTATPPLDIKISRNRNVRR